jgi:hypothetical protein
MRRIYRMVSRSCVPFTLILYDNRRTRKDAEIREWEKQEELSELELFLRFYEQQNNQPMSPEQEAFVKHIMEEIKE